MDKDLNLRDYIRFTIPIGMAISVKDPNLTYVEYTKAELEAMANKFD